MKSITQPKRLMHRTEVAQASTGTGSKAMRALCVVLHWPNSRSGMLAIQLHYREQPGLASWVAPFFTPANIVQRGCRTNVTSRPAFNNIITLTQQQPHFLPITGMHFYASPFFQPSFFH